MSEGQNLFVSYAAEDNTGNKKSAGWVDEFIRYLSVYLHRINSQFPNISKLEDSAKRPASLGPDDGLILVVSENYLKKNLSKSDTPLLSDHSRVYKIDLRPIKKSDQPTEIRTLNEFHFFELDPSQDEFKTLSGADESQNFWLKIIDLAFEIDRTIYKKPVFQSEKSKKIFLAETSYDQVHTRDEIKRELVRHGHTVLPEGPFSGESKELSEQVKQCLKEADLSVHLIGEGYGEIPEGSDKSVVEIQNDLSQEYYANVSESDIESLHRLIWMPMYLKPRTDQQKLYLDQLKDEVAHTAGAEIIQTPLEILKTVIHSRLHLFDSESRAKTLRSTQRSEKKTVYILFDKKDEKEISPIVENLKAKDVEVLLPRFDDKKMEFLESHRHSLVTSDAVLLYANNNLNWVNSKLNDVIKAPGFGKQFPFDAKAIFIKDESIPREKIPSLSDVIMLNGSGKNGKTDIDPFLKLIASS